MTATISRRLVSLADAAAALAVSTRTVRRYIADGQLDAYFYAMGTPSSALIQLGSTKGFDLYRFSEDERKKVAPHLSEIY